MRVTGYAAVMASFLAILLAFASTPVVAQVMSDPAMEKPGTVDIHKGKISGEAEKQFSGEAKAGASREEKAEKEIKARMKGEEKAEVSPETKAKMQGEARTGGIREESAQGEMKTRMKGEEKVKASPEHKAKMMEDKEKGRSEREVGKRPEARGFGEREPGMVERRGAIQERGALREEERGARTDVSSQARGGEAIVARVDRPDNCLRIRSEPSSSSDIVACAAEGETLRLTGVFSEDGRWAQLDNNGWVFFSQLQTGVKRPEAMAAEGEFGQPAAAGAGKRSSKGRSHDYRGFCFSAPGYYWYPGYFWYPGY